MIFGEALVLAFLATTLALLGVSVHGMFTSNQNSIIEMRKLEDKMMEKIWLGPVCSLQPILLNLTINSCKCCKGKSLELEVERMYGVLGQLLIDCS